MLKVNVNSSQALPWLAHPHAPVKTSEFLTISNEPKFTTRSWQLARSTATIQSTHYTWRPTRTLTPTSINQLSGNNKVRQSHTAEQS